MYTTLVENPSMAAGHDIKALRERLGMTQDEFAEALASIRLKDLDATLGDVRGFSKQRVYEWESGIRNPDDLVQIALKYLAKKGG